MATTDQSVSNDSGPSLHYGIDKPTRGSGSSDAYAVDGPTLHSVSGNGIGRGIVWVIYFMLALSACVVTVNFGVLSPFASSASHGRHTPLGSALTKYAVSTVTPFLEVFQVYPPVLTVGPVGELEITDGSSNASVAIVSTNPASCSDVLVVHSFAYSYGVPYVGEYEPPACTFNRVTWNLTVTSAGRQFDRLGIVYFNDTEVFRTSTAEPTQTGIEWTYLKDMTNYLSLFKEPQKLIFDLGNLIDSTYTAAFNVTLTAAYFSAPDSISPADLILPISARESASNAASVFTLPPQTASNLLTLPRNVLKAVFTVAATGQSAEEFWWSNVLQSDVNTFPSYGELYGYSPFREVQLFIDGQLAGVAWPFPIIFTGGVVPGLWRPIVGIDAFDLKEDEIDITPWLPLLCDGNSHNFTIRVSGLNDDGNGNAQLSETTDSYWLVTGKVFIWLDAANHITTGTNITRNTPPPSFQVSSTIGVGADSTNETLVYQVNAQRDLSISSTIHTSKGSSKASWHQSLTFSNFGNFTDEGNIELNVQNTQGYDVSSSGYAKHFSYPLDAFSSYTTFEDNFTISAIINRGKDVQTIGQPVFPTGLESFSTAKNLQGQFPSFQGSSLSTTQNGSATYIANTTSSTAISFGTTEQDMVFAGIKAGVVNNGQFPAIAGSTELFHRYVQAVNSTVVTDQETLVGTGVIHQHLNLDSIRGYAVPGISGTLGHGPHGQGTLGTSAPPK